MQYSLEISMGKENSRSSFLPWVPWDEREATAVTRIEPKCFFRLTCPGKEVLRSRIGKLISKNKVRVFGLDVEILWRFSSSYILSFDILVISIANVTSYDDEFRQWYNIIRLTMPLREKRFFWFRFLEYLNS